MSKFLKLFAIAALIAGALAMTPGPAAAQRHGHRGGHGVGHGGGWHGGGWHGGGWRGGGWRGGGWGYAPGPFWGWSWGYPYYGGYYYGPSDCGWVYVRVLRRGRWVVRRAWRCW
jgi:hypothetical protein